MAAAAYYLAKVLRHTTRHGQTHGPGTRIVVPAAALPSLTRCTPPFVEVLGPLPGDDLVAAPDVAALTVADAAHHGKAVVDGPLRTQAGETEAEAEATPPAEAPTSRPRKRARGGAKG